MAVWLALLALPALANSSAAKNSAAKSGGADIARPLPQPHTSLASLSGDKDFHRLFASWKALDETGPAGAARSASISIPSLMPLDMSYLTSGFGYRQHPILGGRRRHKGIDLSAPRGTPVYATADGVVSRARWVSGYGRLVEIAHGAKLETRYAHMSRLAVAPGEEVHKGDVIGYVGSTGRSTGPHLHYEVRIDGIAVNPIPYMVQSKAQERFAYLLAPGGAEAGPANGATAETGTPLVGGGAR